MNLRQIEVFRAVMLTGSITDAARLLHVSQPGISRLVRHLEIRLGTPLFERTRGKLVATPEAHALHAEIENVYRGVKDVQDFAAGLRTGAHALLRIGTTPSLGLEVVPRAVARLATLFPATRLSLEVLTLAQTAEGLLDGHVDVAVSALPIDHPGIELLAIGEWRMALAMPPGHPLARKRRIGIRDALGYPLVAFAPDTVQGRILAEWYAREGLERRVAIQVRSAHTACALVACGAGVAVVDDLTARACASRTLVARPILPSPAFAIYTVHARDRPPSVPARRFCAILAEVLPRRRAGDGTPGDLLASPQASR